MDHFLGRNDEQMQCRGILHVVEAGDTLYKIGKKYGVPVSRVMYANPYVNVYNLQAGDEICVPVMTPRMPMEEDDMPLQMDQNRMGERGMPLRQDSGMPVRENPMIDSRMPARENPTMDTRMPARENPMMDTRMPAYENPVEESRMPARRDRMGFPLAPLEEVTVDVSRETENGVYMGNRMASAEDSRRRGMWEADPRPEEDQSMRNQPDTDHKKERAGADSREEQQNQSQSESMHAGEHQEMQVFTESQETAGINDADRNIPKALPWEESGVSEQMMQEYLQEVPG